MEGFKSVDNRLTNIKDNLNRAMPDIIAQSIMIEVMAMHKDRIFDKGLRTNGSLIGTYSKKEGYFGVDSFVRKAAFKPLGKPNKEGKRKVNTTMYISTGYHGLREIQARRVDRKTLKYTGSLENNIQVVRSGNMVSYGTTDVEESKKFNGLEDDYRAFGLSVKEKTYVKEEIAIHATEIAKKK